MMDPFISFNTTWGMPKSGPWESLEGPAKGQEEPLVRHAPAVEVRRAKSELC